MSRSLQKLINGKLDVKKNKFSGAFHPVSEACTVHTASTGRFAGMSKHTEIIEPVIIPGYKIRG